MNNAPRFQKSGLLISYLLVSYSLVNLLVIINRLLYLFLTPKMPQNHPNARVPYTYF